MCFPSIERWNGMKKTTILIADDELLIRIGIRNLIDSDDFEILGEAENGEQTLSQIEHLGPDILLLDITMPGMSGLEVLKEIQRRNICVKIVILSYHDDFEFVHTALTGGAVDYILKSDLSKEHILSTLRNIRDIQINENQSEINQKLAGEGGLNAELVRKNLFLNLIYGQPVPENPAGSLSMEFFPVICLAFRIVQYAAVRNRYKERDIGFITQSLFSVLEQALINLPTYELIAVGENQFALILALPKGRPAKEVAVQIIETLTRLAKTYVNIDLYFGMGLPSEDYGGIHRSYRQAVTALREVFFHPKSSYQLYDPKRERESEELAALENQMKRLCISRSYHQLAEAAEHYFSIVRDFPYTNPKEVKVLFADIANLLSLQEGNKGFEREDTIQQANSLDEVEDIFFHAIPGPFLGDEERNHIIKSILQYIEKHYASPLSVVIIAEALGFSENYLSRIFNRIMDIGIPDYINRVRIERAKELLQSTNLKIYTIAEEVGFNSVPYFNVIFKQQEQCTPNEYRNGLN